MLCLCHCRETSKVGPRDADLPDKSAQSVSPRTHEGARLVNLGHPSKAHAALVLGTFVSSGPF